MHAEIKNPDLASVLDSDAVTALHDVYNATESLRRTIQVCHTAVYDALDAGDACLTDRHIAAAANAEYRTCTDHPGDHDGDHPANRLQEGSPHASLAGNVPGQGVAG